MGSICEESGLWTALWNVWANWILLETRQAVDCRQTQKAPGMQLRLRMRVLGPPSHGRASRISVQVDELQSLSGEAVSSELFRYSYAL